jgi:hypothetical protein
MTMRSLGATLPSFPRADAGTMTGAAIRDADAAAAFLRNRRRVTELQGVNSEEVAVDARLLFGFGMILFPVIKSG